MGYILTILMLIGLVGLIIMGISFIFPFIISAVQFLFWAFLAVMVGIKDNPETARMIVLPILLISLASLLWEIYKEKRH